MKIVFICHYSPSVSLKIKLRCYKHVLVLLTEESQYSKGVLTLKLIHLSVMRHYKLVKLPMQLNASCMVLGADNVHGVGFWRAAYVLIFSSAPHSAWPRRYVAKLLRTGSATVAISAPLDHWWAQRLGIPLPTSLGHERAPPLYAVSCPHFLRVIRRPTPPPSTNLRAGWEEYPTFYLRISFFLPQFFPPPRAYYPMLGSGTPNPYGSLS